MMEARLGTNSETPILTWLNATGSSFLPRKRLAQFRDNLEFL